MLTLNKVANLLSVSRDTARRLVLDGDIPAYRVGKQFRVRSEDLDAYLTPMLPKREDDHVADNK
jgi:excisionase family DNA binding protein